MESLKLSFGERNRTIYILVYDQNLVVFCGVYPRADHLEAVVFLASFEKALSIGEQANFLEEAMQNGEGILRTN